MPSITSGKQYPKATAPLLSSTPADGVACLKVDWLRVTDASHTQTSCRQLQRAKGNIECDGAVGLGLADAALAVGDEQWHGVGGRKHWRKMQSSFRHVDHLSDYSYGNGVVDSANTHV